MHNVDFDLGIEELSKVEGHAGLAISVRNGTVENVKLKITHNKRFFTQAAVGKSFSNVHQTLSRICGTCSIAHMICSLRCVENALGVLPSQQTIALRDLSMHGMTIRDHAMHLYLFCLPDIFRKDSILDFSGHGKEHRLIHKAFAVKQAGNLLSREIAGRAVHPPYLSVGTFQARQAKDKAKLLLNALKKCRDDAIEFVELFADVPFVFESDAEFLALTNRDFSFQYGEIVTSGGLCISPSAFAKFLKKTIIKYSQASGFSFQGRPYMVGALARVNVNLTGLHRDTRKALRAALGKFPSTNVYDNNLAQAIEIVHCIDRSIELLEAMEWKEEQPPAIIPKESEGVGVIEAPRGTLYHHFKINKVGLLTYANLIIPTAQNQVKMERDIGILVQQLLDQGLDRDAIRKEVEIFIRSFDPCMSCATHFLKLKWQ